MDIDYKKKLKIQTIVILVTVVITTVIVIFPIISNQESIIEGFSSLYSKMVTGSASQADHTIIRVVTEESATIDVVESSSPSVVSVAEKSISYDFFSRPQSQESSIGTGFVVSKNTIISNKHVVSDLNATYSIVDSKGEKHEVTNIIRDPFNDLAILEVSDLVAPELEMGDSNEIQVGQTVIAIGNALGRFSNSVTKGVISGIGRGITTGSGFGRFQEQLDDVIQTDAALNPGNSGGPLLNLSGQVVGVNVAVSSDGENIGFAIPVSRVAKLLDDIKAGTLREKPFLGISYSIVTTDISKESGYPTGALVQVVVPGSAAEIAGVKVGDVITKVGDVTIDDDHMLADEILFYNVGDKVSLVIIRDGKNINVTATLKALSE
ncbi:trypsin-like serine protease [bacterium]|uniref:PDZ domain-containing protein n=2 Tax=Katanobacteria TaxID=422282 RepID=A0A2M7X2Y7_UNCKA|nr:trypsin-like serine protease [bacterium]PIP56933.1 MAG: hypothetical protein COX05_00355 [candidate division WWE3 bacterium CG22_combo_CG10-13_8_21_14_all_39_12]PJA40498.1 MAG: hypothetical protein CO179_02060 [candidate division WWE3 bacterium CG_4_9_14_3_um_filter_39_7]